MPGPDVEFELVWVGPYAYRTMLMEKMRHSRLFFIGDAAHAVSPFGARGGNAGIMDADNLGWRLALVLTGAASAGLLDHYQLERHRAAQENIRITSRSGRFMQPRSQAEFRLRRAVLLNTGRLCTPHHYGGLASVGPRPQDGKAVPNVALVQAGQGTDLIALLRAAGNRAIAFVFGAVTQPFFHALETARLPLQVFALHADFEDPHALLATQTETPAGGIALIRPDSHLAASLPTADAAALIAAARRTLGG